MTFSMETKISILNASSGYCMNDGCYSAATEFHHIVPNTKVNQKLYPLYLQSPFNCFAICNNCHMTKVLKDKPNEQIIQAYEEYLQGLAKGI